MKRRRRNCDCRRCRRRNPVLSVEDGLFVFADDKPIKDSWYSVSEENLVSVGPFPPIVHYPGTYILYLLRDPQDKDTFIEMAGGGKEFPLCKKCNWSKNWGEAEPCCFATKSEFEWYDEDDEYIGPPKYDPETGSEEFPECECKCECLYLPVFQMHRPYGAPGTLNQFWNHKSSDMLVGAVQYIASNEDSNLIITHMAVKEAYRRNKINTFLIDQVVKDHPHRRLLFHELTPKGRSFMKSYGGEDYDKRDDQS